MIKDILGYEGQYAITSNGVVVNCKTNKQLKFDDSHGYDRVTLSKNGCVKKHLVHRLVALCFIPNEFNKPFINHKDGNKHNNNVENLEWCTGSENEKHSYQVLNKKSPCYWKGKFGKNNASSKPICQYDLNGNFIMRFDSQADAERVTGISAKHMSSVCKGVRYQTGGFIWKYDD